LIKDTDVQETDAQPVLLTDTEGDRFTPAKFRPPTVMVFPTGYPDAGPLIAVMSETAGASQLKSLNEVPTKDDIVNFNVVDPMYGARKHFT
jgi:hypothetical protein